MSNNLIVSHYNKYVLRLMILDYLKNFSFFEGQNRMILDYLKNFSFFEGQNT